MSNLLIQLPAEYTSAGGEYSYVLSNDGLHILRSGQAAASLLAGGRSTQVTVVIPPALLSWHCVSLPPGLQLRSRRHQQRVRAVLDGLLEEKLLDDPAQLHLALADDAVAGQPCWVAACDKAWLQAHLQMLEAAGHNPSRIAPLVWPSERPGLLLSGDANQAQLTITGLEQKISLAQMPLQADSALLQSLLSQLPAGLPLLAEPQHARAAEALQRPISIHTSSQQLLAAAKYSGDLAQFDLDLGGSTRIKRRLLDAWQSFAKAPQWRAARWAAGIAIVAQLLGLNAWAFKENRSIAQRQQQSKQVLQTTFPHIPVIVDAPVQMQRELDLLRSNSGALSSNDAEALLAASAGISGVQNAKVLQYQDRQLRISGLNLTPEALSDAQQSLQATGYQLNPDGADLLLTTKTQR